MDVIGPMDINAHALIIGVAAYQEIAHLPQSIINDAKDVYDMVTSPRCGYDASNVALLLDSEATLENIRQQFAELERRAGPSDTVFIYFSGHGAKLANSSALVPVDASLHDLSSTTFGESELSHSLGQLSSRKTLVCIDACHAGGVASFKNAIGGSVDITLGFSDKSLSNLSQGVGRVLIASSKASETSLVLGGARNSLFTTYLLKALQGEAYSRGDGLIRVFDIFNYVSESVRATVPGKQTPIFKASDLEENFPVSLLHGGLKSISLNGSTKPFARKIEQVLSELYPLGPQDQDIWLRSGGDISRLNLTGTGRSKWFSAIRLLNLGGGGESISQASLLAEALSEFPHHPELASFID